MYGVSIEVEYKFCFTVECPGKLLILVEIALENWSKSPGKPWNFIIPKVYEPWKERGFVKLQKTDTESLNGEGWHGWFCHIYLEKFWKARKSQF